ncbi:exodeoxyribonuclease III [Opitutia bacterium SCGC AG-212-L18]|nr:exodeoxyribonuclease III [Opitutae bacterium SCGC AG-212-L18]
MKFICWNVNGVRALLKKGAFEAVLRLGGDVLCLQETKACADTIPELELGEFPYRYFNHADKKGYSGTAILSKIKPIGVEMAFPVTGDKHVQEGRVISAEFEKFFLVNVYVPNSQDGLRRLPYRDKHWDPEFRAYLLGLTKKKPVIVCGDMNVAHEEIDIANPKSNHHSAGFTDAERRNFGELLKAGFIDTFRYFHPNEANHYSWWSYRTKARERNVGWRIDYFLVSESLRPKLKSATIYTEVMGSDHAPVGLELA